MTLGPRLERGESGTDAGSGAASTVLLSLEREDRRQKLLASTRYRDLILAVALGVDLLLLRTGYARVSPIFFGTLVALWAWNRLVARLYRRDRDVTLPLLSGVLDVAACTILVCETGGLRSALLPLYFAVAAGAAAHTGARVGGFLLLLSGMALALLALPQTAAYAASRALHGWPDPLSDPRYRLVVAAAFVASLAPVLFSSALLARETRARERRLAGANASLNALWEIGRELSDTLSTDRVIETTLREMRERFGMASAEMFLLSPEGKLGAVSPAAAAASGADAAAAGLRARLEGSDPVQEGARLYLPLRAKGRVMGLLVAEQPPPGRPLDPGELTTLASLATQTGIALDNARLYEAKEELSRTDGLTQLYNHRFFQERIPEEIKRSDRFRQKLSLVMLDVDDFKRINDSFGHPIGDQVLRRVARIARDCLREVDVPARYGGDEFAIILPDTDLADAIEVAERLRREVEKRPVLAEGTPVALTISLGVATRPPHSPLSSEELLKMADQALLAAKRGGRNTVAHFPAS